MMVLRLGGVQPVISLPTTEAVAISVLFSVGMTWTALKSSGTNGVSAKLFLILCLSALGLGWLILHILRQISTKPYKPRLDLNIEGKLLVEGDFRIASITYKVTNLSLFELTLTQKGSALLCEVGRVVDAIVARVFRAIQSV